MNGTLREHGCGASGDIDLGKPASVLHQDAGAERGVEREVDLRSARVSVRGADTARAEEADR
jgi:hypothetical protein